VVIHLLRAIAGKKPAVVTHVGLNTFADPRVEGCKANDRTRSRAGRSFPCWSCAGRSIWPIIAFPSICADPGHYADELGNIAWSTRRWGLCL
jgi:propionate CoA-transferase